MASEISERREARDCFYATLQRLAPHVHADLGDQCMPAAAQLPPSIVLMGPDHYPAIEPLGSCVRAWAKGHHLAEDWLIADAVEAVLEASCTGSSTVGLCPNERALKPVRVEGTLPDVSFLWSPEAQPRKAFERAMMELLAQRLRTELDRIEAIAADRGLKYEKQRRKLDLHMEWLVRRVVLEWSDEEIADLGDACLDESSVRKGISDVAELIGLEIPTRPPGRPPRQQVRV